MVDILDTSSAEFEPVSPSLDDLAYLFPNWAAKIPTDEAEAEAEPFEDELTPINWAAAARDEPSAEPGTDYELVRIPDSPGKLAILNHAAGIAKNAKRMEGVSQRVPDWLSDDNDSISSEMAHVRFGNV